MRRRRKVANKKRLQVHDTKLETDRIFFQKIASIHSNTNPLFSLGRGELVGALLQVNYLILKGHIILNNIHLRRVLSFPYLRYYKDSLWGSPLRPDFFFFVPGYEKDPLSTWSPIKIVIRVSAPTNILSFSYRWYEKVD